MGILKRIDNAIIDFEIVVLTIIAVILLAANIMVPEQHYYGCQVEVNYTNIRQIQSALALYYADNDKYPDEKYLEKAMKENLGKAPVYKDGRKMIKIYKKVNANTEKESYKIYFNDDHGTEVKESKYMLTDGTNTRELFGEDDERNNHSKFIIAVPIAAIMIAFLYNLFRYKDY